MSSLVVASPDVLASASQDLSGVGLAITAANLTAAPSTTSVSAAALDEVSAAVASVFSGHAQQFQAASAKAAAFHAQFVQTLHGAGSAYTAAEAANASPLQGVEPGAQSLESGLSSLTKEQSLGPGTYGPGVYADGRVIVDPGAQITIGRGGSLNVSPTSEVIVGRRSQIGIEQGGSLNVGHASRVELWKTSDLLIGPAVPVTVGPNAELVIGTNFGEPWFNLVGGQVIANGPFEINYSGVFIGRATGYEIYLRPVTINHGTVYGQPFIAVANPGIGGGVEVIEL
jgi:hypothetical protein